MPVVRCCAVLNSTQAVTETPTSAIKQNKQKKSLNNNKKKSQKIQCHLLTLSLHLVSEKWYAVYERCDFSCVLYPQVP